MTEPFFISHLAVCEHREAMSDPLTITDEDITATTGEDTSFDVNSLRPTNNGATLPVKVNGDQSPSITINVDDNGSPVDVESVTVESANVKVLQLHFDIFITVTTYRIE